MKTNVLIISFLGILLPVSGSYALNPQPEPPSHATRMHNEQVKQQRATIQHKQRMQHKQKMREMQQHRNQQRLNSQPEHSMTPCDKKAMQHKKHMREVRERNRKVKSLHD